MEMLDKMFNSLPDFKMRAVSSVVIVAVIIGGILLGGYYWSAVVIAAATLSLREFYKLLPETLHASYILVMLSGALLLIGASVGIMDSTVVICSISVVSFIALFLEVMKRQVTGESTALVSVGATVSGLAYIVLPWSFMILIRSRENGTMFLITLFMCTWACDVAAYFTGSRFGKHLLCSQVSPHKTWEGFAGGVVGSFFTAGLMSLIFLFPPLPLLLLGLLCGIAGQLGDLGESVLKREAGVKDTGNIIPGHGGLLDRFDSILINATLAFVIFGIAANV
ncbi:MAG: phosphatidate cytidylyltransferase [Synergistes sp.]|nr:phosphatidate cytidylyltransferase [Synergistes sp.]